MLAGLWRDSRGPQTAMATTGMVYRSAGGLAHLPAEGGLLDQPAWLMEALAVMTNAAAEIQADQGG